MNRSFLNFSLFFCFIAFYFGQVQEKKVKKVCEMNLDPSKAMGNGPVVSCVSTSSKQCHANGGCKERTISYPNNDTLFPSGGFSSLKLPTVVVFRLSFFFFYFIEAYNFGI